MTNEASSIRRIAVENLLIDLQNPRYDPRTNQREAIATIAHDQGVKLANLAEDIVDKGLNPSELPMVTPTDDGATYTVLEGNRRIAALKLLLSPALVTSLALPPNLIKRYKELHVRSKGTIPSEIGCVVLPREDANYWIDLRHTGENEGVGVVPWDGVQTHRFRGNSAAFQAIELVKSSAFLDDGTRKRLPKIAITNIERLLTTPEARKLLGVDVKGGQLILVTPEEDAIARLSLVISDVANKRIKVGDVETREDRISYAQEIASQPLPKPVPPDSGHSPTAKTPPAPTGGSTPPGSGRKIPPDRKTVIPKRFSLAISQPRINRIYHELQKLDLDQFVNSGAVMFRVFLELSVEDFAKRHSISLKIPSKKPPAPGTPPAPPRDMTLREKLTAVADHLDAKGVCTTAELRGVRALIANRDHVLSVDSLNAYVHNKDYSPTPDDLKTSWDNIQVFMEHTWTV